MQATLHMPLTLTEIIKALNELAANKTPGPNEVATKSYKVLWPIIGPEYHHMIQEAIAKGELLARVIEGLIALLNTTSRLVICNGVFTLATMFFLGVWGGTCIGIAKLKAKVA
jgi:hypothetical protein